jgi:glycosyltransferase involved in cell wall biosynthesis
MRRTIPRAQALLAVSAHTARQLTARLGVPPERIVVVPNGIDELFHPRSASGLQCVAERYGLPERYVIYAGSIHPRKNVARLIRAFASARRERALPHHLILVGGLGWHFDDVLAAMREVNAASAAEVVRSLGRVPDVDLAPLIAGADCLAYPSLDEGFGLPMVEAMACGTPVLTSRIAALEEVAGDAAVLVAPHDEPAIAAALGALCTESTLREQLRDRGLAQAARYRWSQVADETLRVYQRLAGASSATRMTRA